MFPGGNMVFRFATATLLCCVLAGTARAEEAPPPLDDNVAPAEEVMELALRSAVVRALESNLDIAVERYNPDIKDAELLTAKGEFDPNVKAEFTYSDVEMPQTAAEGLASDAATTATVEKDIIVSVDGKVPTGTEYSVAFESVRSQFTQRNTFIDPDPLVPGDEFFGDVRSPSEYNLDLTFGLTQPLLKDFGFGPNLAEVRIARSERGMSIEDFRKRVIDVIAEVQSTYWNLAAAIANLRVTEASLKTAQDLLEENRIRLKVGTMAPLEVLQAEAGVAQREEEVIVARSLIKDVEDSLKQLLNLPKDTEEWNIRIVPTDRPVVVDRDFNKSELLKRALEKRPDYKRALMQVETDAINEVFTRNQLLPAVDLEGEYQFRSVAAEFDDAFDDIEEGTSPSWLAGVTAEYPIGNRTAKGENKKARLEREQSEKEVENLRVSIIVEVNKAIRDIQTSLKRIEVTEKSVELAEETLKAERKKLEVGVSTSHDVLEFEEELADAQRRRILAFLDHEQALINLSAAVGTMLEENNIVVEDAS